MSTIIKIAQLVISVGLIILVLLQEKGTGVSETFGGGTGSGFYQHRRGLEKIMFIVTIVALILFAATSLANLFIR
jgi:preprotein translocase subunit SecG